MILIRISFCIPTTISSLIFHGTGCSIFETHETDKGGVETLLSRDSESRRLESLLKRLETLLSLASESLSLAS